MTKSNALESLVIAGFVRGLSVRDVETTLAEALGAEAALSKSTVSRICQAIGDEFDHLVGQARWTASQLDYLFLDASMFKMHPGARAEPVLAAWGIDTDGKPVFVAPRPRRQRVHRRLGRASSTSCAAGGCAHRCWSSPTARPG